eukprot:751768-Hanusia_phi.AAC.1
MGSVRVRSMRGADISLPIASSSSFGDLRALVAQRLGGATTSVLVHHGEVVRADKSCPFLPSADHCSHCLQMKDEELVSTRISGEEEVRNYSNDYA